MRSYIMQIIISANFGYHLVVFNYFLFKLFKIPIFKVGITS